MCQRKKILEESAKVEKVLSKFKTHSITKTNQLFHAVVVTNRLRVIDKVAWRKERMWRRRLKNKITKIQGRMPNSKSPGSDLVQGFWLRNLVVCMKGKGCS